MCSPNCKCVCHTDKCRKCQRKRCDDETCNCDCHFCAEDCDCDCHVDDCHVDDCNDDDIGFETVPDDEANEPFCQSNCKCPVCYPQHPDPSRQPPNRQSAIGKRLEELVKRLEAEEEKKRAHSAI